MWSTFNETDQALPPVPNDPILLNIARVGHDLKTLGIESGHTKRGFDDACLVLQYYVPKDRTLHKPTIIEGYAGGLHYYFRTRGGAGSGRVLTAPYGADFPGFPEVVHAIICADKLTAPIKIERAH